MIKVFANFRFYTKKGKRIAAFAERFNDTKMLVTYSITSEEDNFIKRKAWEAYRLHDFNTVPEIKEKLNVTLHATLVDMHDINNMGKSLRHYLADNYYVPIPDLKAEWFTNYIKADFLIN